MKFDQPRRFRSTIALPLRVAERRQRAGGDRVQPRALAAHVQHLDRGQRTAVDPPRQAQHRHPVHALRPRRRAAGDQERTAARGPLGGDVPGVVARVALVLVGGVVLLVEDDQPQVGDRREDGRAGPDADARLALAQAPPLLVALAGRHAGVHHRDGVAEARGEAREDLRRERDLRDHHDHAAPRLERRLGGAQVDLGLAGSRDAVQQRAPALAAAQGGQQRLERRALIGAELGRPRGTGADGALARRRDGPAPAAAQALRGARRQHQAEGSGERRAVLGGDPARKLDELGGDPRLQRAQRREQPLGGQLARVGHPDDDAQQLAGAERHDEHRADRRARAEILAEQVVERPLQGARGRDRLDAHDRAAAGTARGDDALGGVRRGARRRQRGVCRGGCSHRPDPRGRRGQRPAALRSALALSVRSQVKSWSSRPKWP